MSALLRQFAIIQQGCFLRHPRQVRFDHHLPRIGICHDPLAEGETFFQRRQGQDGHAGAARLLRKYGKGAIPAGIERLHVA